MATRSRSEVSLCLKYFLFFSNFAIMVISLTGDGGGIWILAIKQKSITTVLDLILDGSFWLVIIGSSFGLISFFGCFGALREQIVFLKIYHWLITFGILLELIAIIVVFLFYYQPDVLKKIKIYPEELFEDGINKYPDADEDVNDFIEFIQQDLVGCCGFSNDDEGYKQWGNNMYYNCSDDNISPLKCGVPESCCKYQSMYMQYGLSTSIFPSEDPILQSSFMESNKDGEPKNLLCGQNVANKSPSEVSGKIYTRGCLKGIGDMISENAVGLGVIIAVVLTVQMTAIYFAKNLIFQINQQIKKWKYNSR